MELEPKPENIKQMGMDALVQLCQKLKAAFKISFRFKKYGYTNQTCTIEVYGISSITKRGEDACEQAIKEAIITLINTYQSLSHLKNEIKEEPKICEPLYVESIIPQ